MLVSKDTILIYRNERGLSLTLAPFTDFFLEGCLETVDNSINSQKLRYLDGEYFDNSTLDPRHIEITGFFNTVTNRREMDRTLKRVFNMSLEGELSYRRRNSSSNVFTINCRLEKLPEIEFNEGSVNFIVNLKCFNPYWQGKPTTENISMINKLGRFPLVIPKGEKFVFGYRAQTLKTTFDNIGDTKTGAVYTLRADGGTVMNPSITHENSGYTLKIFYTLQNNEKIVVTSTPEYVGIIIYKADGTTLNGMPLLSDETKRQFFMLEFGENTISYNADNNVTNLSVSAAYTPLYLEVF